MLVNFSRLHFFSHRKIKRTKSIQSIPSVLSNLVIKAVVTSVNNINDKFVKLPMYFYGNVTYPFPLLHK